MNIERFLVKGKRLDGMGWIEGFVYIVKPYARYHILPYDNYADTCLLSSNCVIPATIEPVSAGVVIKGNGNIFCPNCNKRIGGMKDYDYCGYCGQRLDWDV